MLFAHTGCVMGVNDVRRLYASNDALSPLIAIDSWQGRAGIRDINRVLGSLIYGES